MAKNTNKKEEEEEEEATSQGRGHALAQQDEQRTSNSKQVTVVDLCTYCMSSSLTSVLVVVGWSTNQSKPKQSQPNQT
jgi:hypothetical protein